MLLQKSQLENHSDFKNASKRFSLGGCAILSIELFKYFSSYGWKFVQFKGYGDHSLLCCPNEMFAVDVFGIEHLQEKQNYHITLNKNYKDNLNIYFINPSIPTEYNKIIKFCKNYKEKLPNSIQDFNPDQQTKFWAKRIFEDAQEKYPELFA